MQESTFASLNKPWLDASAKFSAALSNGDKLPDRLRTDAGHVLRILTADTADVQTVQESVTLLEGFKRSQEQILSLNDCVTPLTFDFVCLV